MSSRSISTDDLLAHASFLRRLCRELVRDAHAADDLVQDTLIAALERPPQETGSIKSWLATVAANLSRNNRRGQARRNEREHATAREERVEGDQLALDCIEVQQQVLQHLLALPVEQRTVLFMRYYEDLSPSAIADRLRVPVKTIKSRHTRALAALRERLDQRSEGDRTRWMSALAPASALRGFGAGWTTALGGLAVKKMLVAVAVVLVAILAWRSWTTRANTAPTGDVGVAASELDASKPDAPPVLAPIAESRSREPSPVTTSSANGTLEVHLAWSDGSAAAGIGLDVRCDTSPWPRDEAFRGVTDARGVATVADLPAGPVTITLDMRERFQADVAAGTTRKVEHTIEAGIEVTGRVVDAKGAPVANASIWRNGRGSARCPDVKLACACADDGTFVLRDLLPYATFDARARGHRPSNAFRVDELPATDSGKRSITLRLGEPGGRVTGIVLDPDGKPIEHAHVMAGARGGFIVDSPDRIRSVSPSPAAVETGGDGRFELFDDFEAGKQTIYAAARGFPVWEGSVDVALGERKSVEIRLQRPARIEGRLIGLDGQSLPGVEVLAAVEDRGGWSWTPFSPSKCTSNAAGGFVIDWVAAGSCELNASDDSRPEIGRAHALVECEADRTTTVELRMERGHVIAGRVVDEHGAPVVGWSVDSESVSVTEQWYPRRAKTAADGSFALLNVGAGRSNLVVRAPRTIVEQARANGIRAGASDVVLVVKDARERKGTLQGRLVDPSGRVLDDVTVTVWGIGQFAGQFVEFDKGTGRFREPRLAGKYRLDVMRGTRTILSTKEFVITEGEVQDLGDLVFSSAGALEVTIALAAELSPETERINKGLRLALVPVDGAHDEKLERKDGAWRAESLAPGRWRVEMHESELCLRDAEVVVREGETTRVEMRLELAVRVQIAFPNHGQAGFTVEARDAGGKFLRRMRVQVTTSSDESIVGIGLPVGRAKVEVRSDDGRLSGSLDVDVVRGSSRGKPLRIELH